MNKLPAASTATSLSVPSSAEVARTPSPLKPPKSLATVKIAPAGVILRTLELINPRTHLIIAVLEA